MRLYLPLYECVSFFSVVVVHTVETDDDVPDPCACGSLLAALLESGLLPCVV